MDYPSAPAFRAAGYAAIRTNASYSGGLVRQHGRVSFSRVFQAGHSVAYYQPETVYRVFNRAILGRDVATGQVVAGSNYSSEGPASSFYAVKETLPDSPPSVCWLYVSESRCTEDQKKALKNGTAVIKDFVVVSPPGSPGGPTV